MSLVVPVIGEIPEQRMHLHAQRLQDPLELRMVAGESERDPLSPFLNEAQMSWGRLYSAMCEEA
jgi:hypothetical protein